MRVLLVKTSSMGDIIHTLPALTDAGKAYPDIRFDWLIEDSFQEIPTWHPLVHRVIPVALRRWRKGLLSAKTRNEWQTLRQQLHDERYDIILDAQGLVKSAFLTFFAHGLRVGLDWKSARESLASLAYQRKCNVNFYQHAVVRMRSLFSQALDYPLPKRPPNFGLLQGFKQVTPQEEKYVVFLHGTTWATKEWPEIYWAALAEQSAQAGYRVKISGGNADEVARALRIAKHSKLTEGIVDVLPYLSITQMADLLAGASAAVAVDTGFGHLAAALNVPTVSLYGATNPAYTSAIGVKSSHLAAAFPCSPCLSRVCAFKGSTNIKPACYATLTPTYVWDAVLRLV